jgi:hypothetical protein
MSTPLRQASAAEQRAALRVPAAQVPSIQGVRISGNDDVSTLVNISTSGVLVECAFKPRPGSAVTLDFLGTFTPATIRGRVARTIVASLNKHGILRYMVGIAFETPIVLDPLEAAADRPTADASPDSGAMALPELAPAPRLSSRLQNRW